MANRTTVKIGPAIDAKLYKEFVAVAKENGQSQRFLLEKAIEHYIHTVVPSQHTVRLEVMEAFRRSNEKFQDLYRKLAEQMAGSVYLTVGEVLQIHHQLINDYGGTHGVRDKGLLESAVFRPQIGYYSNIAEEAAALMESLANNHPFLDGNKRVAFAAAHTFLLVNGHDLEVHPLVAYDFMMQSIAKGTFRFGPILKWINDHIR